MASKLVIVTGMSGAGRMSCLRLLEDIGFQAVDNLPVALLERLAAPSKQLSSSLAIGMDSRTQGFSPKAVIEALDAVRAVAKEDVELLFFDCEDEVLRRRYTETRRRHPMAPEKPLMDSIALEREFMSPLKELSDEVFDTSELSIPELRAILNKRFGSDSQNSLSVSITSFAFRNGLPREADMVFDVRFLANPHYLPELRDLTGIDKKVAAFVEKDAGFRSFFAALIDMVLPLLPRFETEGKSYLTIAIGCTGGQHRSVAVAEKLGATLKDHGWEVTVMHREEKAREASDQRFASANKR